MNISRIRDLVSLFALMTMLFCACGNPNGKGSQFPTPSSTANQSIPTPSSVTNQSFPLSITLTNCIDQWTILRYELLTQEEFNGQIKYPLQGSSFLRIYMDPSSTNPGNLIDLWKGNEVFITDGQEDKYLSTAILTSTSNDDLFIEFQSIPNDRQNFILHFLNWPPVSLNSSYSPPVNCPTPSPMPTPASYKVVEGDTWLSIALKFDVSIENLLSANHGVSSNSLAVGTIIFIPAK